MHNKFDISQLLRGNSSCHIESPPSTGTFLPLLNFSKCKLVAGEGVLVQSFLTLRKLRA